MQSQVKNGLLEETIHVPSFRHGLGTHGAFRILRKLIVFYFIIPLGWKTRMWLLSLSSLGNHINASHFNFKKYISPTCLTMSIRVAMYTVTVIIWTCVIIEIYAWTTILTYNWWTWCFFSSFFFVKFDFK